MNGRPGTHERWLLPLVWLQIGILPVGILAAALSVSANRTAHAAASVLWPTFTGLQVVVIAAGVVLHRRSIGLWTI